MPTLPAALPLCCFPRCCSQKLDGPYDNRVLPVVVTGVLMTFLTVVWIGSIIRWAGLRLLEDSKTTHVPVPGRLACSAGCLRWERGSPESLAVA